jgi:hypothetical protein
MMLWYFLNLDIYEYYAFLSVIREKEQNMITQKKMVFTLGVLLYCTLVSALHVRAQPFGILSPKDQQLQQKRILTSQNGRFVFGQISDSSKDQFMLDTLTGRLWRIAERGDLGMFLKSVPYCDPEGECSAVPKKIQASEDKPVEKR